MIISCKDASQLISKSLDQRLSFFERLKLRLHLLICDVCTRFNQQLYMLQSAIKKLLNQTENESSIQLPDHAKARIQKLIEAAITEKISEVG